MKKQHNPKDLYEYQKGRQEEYLNEINEIISIFNDETKDRLTKLIYWFGKSRHMQSKAYQDLKSQER